MAKKLLISSPDAESLRKEIQGYFFVENNSVVLEPDGAVSRVNVSTGNRQKYENHAWRQKGGRFTFFITLKG